MQTDEDDLRKIIMEWDNAMLSNDAVLIGRYMTADWVILGSDGLTTRELFLESISSGSVSHSRMDSDNLIIHLHEHVAIAYSRGTSAGLYNGTPFSMYEWSTNIFVKNAGNWLCASTTVLPAK